MMNRLANQVHDRLIDGLVDLWMSLFSADNVAASSVPAAVFVGVVGGLIMIIFLMLFFMMCVIGVVRQQQRNKDSEGEHTNNNCKHATQ